MSATPDVVRELSDGWELPITCDICGEPFPRVGLHKCKSRKVVDTTPKDVYAIMHPPATLGRKLPENPLYEDWTKHNNPTDAVMRNGRVALPVPPIPRPPAVRLSGGYQLAGDTSLPANQLTKVWDSLYEGLLVTENHKRLPNGAWSGGGAFRVVKCERSHTGTRIFPCRVAGQTKAYCLHGVNLGKVTQTTTAPSQASAQSWADEQNVLSNAYATGFRKARPGNPVADLGQFIGELRDLPTVPKAFLRLAPRLAAGGLTGLAKGLMKECLDFRNLGSEYLNIVFGWRPFVNDLKKCFALQQTIGKKLAQLVNENGKTIRRRATIYSNTSTEAGPYNAKAYAYPFYGVCGAPPNYYPGATYVTDMIKTTERVWFSGRFRYYVPNIGSPQWTRRAVEALYGVNPTPHVLWELMPWSWLIDWFANVGDVISNSCDNAVDNLTCLHSHVMRSVEVNRTISVQTSCFGRGTSMGDYWYAPSFDGTFVYQEVTTTKSRVGGGNPFGLGVKPGSLTGYQLGILAALGISKSFVR